MLDKAYYCYMVASKTGVIYIGVTGKLRKRVWRHKTHEFEGFSDKYNCERLVWAQMFDNPHDAISREKQLKGWRRDKKVKLIQS